MCLEKGHKIIGGMDPSLVGPTISANGGEEVCVRYTHVDMCTEYPDIIPTNNNCALPKLLENDFDEKSQFVASCPLFYDWPNKWQEEVRASLRSVTVRQGDHIFQQGDPVECIYFILRGEVKLVIEPRAHEEQFASFFQACEPLADNTGHTIQNLPWLALLVRYGGQRLQRCGSWVEDKPDTGYDPMDPAVQIPLPSSPSGVRKQKALLKKQAPRYNVCILGQGQLLGDAEVLLDLDRHYASAYSVQSTTLLWLPKTQFNYIFRQKNPQCIPVMLRHIALAMTRRIKSRSLSEKAPLLKCILYKVQEKLGQRKPVEKEIFLFPLLRKKKHSKVKDTEVSGEEEPQRLAWEEGIPEKNDKRTKTAEQEEDNLVEVPTEGIFQKVLQLSNPSQTRQDMQVGNKEYKYLMSLRRRIGTKLSDISPARVPVESSSQEGRISRPCRQRKNVTLGSRKTDASGVKCSKSKKFSKFSKFSLKSRN